MARRRRRWRRDRAPAGWRRRALGQFDPHEEDQRRPWYQRLPPHGPLRMDLPYHPMPGGGGRRSVIGWLIGAAALAAAGYFAYRKWFAPAPATALPAPPPGTAVAPAPAQTWEQVMATAVFGPKAGEAVAATMPLLPGSQDIGLGPGVVGYGAGGAPIMRV